MLEKIAVNWFGIIWVCFVINEDWDTAAFSI